MKKITIIFVFLFSITSFSQENGSTSYKKRVLETAEVDIISSFYTQDGDNASVTGGIGTEKLNNFATNFVLSIPLNDNNILTIDATISAYTSASSSNLNPFRSSASKGEDDDDDNKNGSTKKNAINTSSSPWVAASGASKGDIWKNINVNYSHSSLDRNTISSANASFSTEFDYVSIGFGAGVTKLFNKKNTEVSLKGNVYLDHWKPAYPTELDSYFEANQNLNNGFFEGIEILDNTGAIMDKNGAITWTPFNSPKITNTERNTYSTSLSFSQILSKKAQISLFVDVVQQKGWLSNPMQRVYFKDRDNYYIGSPESIENYTSPTNKSVFQLADDIERLPNTRFKIPVGARLNYYLNEKVTLRTYYRYYYDDWGITSQTVSIELPVKITDSFTLYPTYRYYSQTAADYFAPFEEHVSTSEFYTSDYDLSEFNSSQIGFGMSYTDIFAKRHIWKLGLKSVDIKFSSYKRNTGLKAGIFSAGFKFVMD